MGIVLIDIPDIIKKFYPLTMTRPIGKLRVGIFTIEEKWHFFSGLSVSHLAESHLIKKYPATIDSENIYINSCILPDENLMAAISTIKENDGLFDRDTFLAAKGGKELFENTIQHFDFSRLKKTSYSKEYTQLTGVTDIFNFNGSQIRADICHVSNNETYGNEINATLYNRQNIFIDESANLKSCILDADEGPIYIGKNASVLPGSIIIGPAAVLDNCTISYGAQIRPNTTIGPYSKVGGELSNVVFMGYSNKSHDGFLGSSVIGSWCNFGAGTNNSNLKNNYGMVKIWDYEEGIMKDSGLQYCGLIMGDHSKCGINTMFNTGTVVGICANIFGSDFMPKHIPSFSWGNQEYEFEKAMKTIEVVKSRRNETLDAMEIEIMKYILNYSEKYRNGNNTL